MNTIEEGLAALARGEMLVVVDDENRENEGDLVIDAVHAGTEAVNFMARFGRGLICVPMEADRLRQLGIDQMVTDNTDTHCTAFTVSVDHVSSTTGISAAERAATVRALLDPASVAADFRRPGHIFPLAAKEGGVLERPGHTEAAVDLARLSRLRRSAASPTKTAALPNAGVICEIMNDDGSMARLPQLEDFCARHKLLMISIADLVLWRRSHEKLVERVVETSMPTRYGDFRMYGFREIFSGKEHVALVMGTVDDGAPVLGRVHSECLTGDALGSQRCDCGEQYDAAMKRIAAEGRGVLVYLRQEGRGIGLLNKLKAYALQDGGLDTVDANVHLGFAPDLRDYHVGSQILKNLGVRQLRLMSNNPTKIDGLAQYGISIVERVRLQTDANKHNHFYLRTKQERMQHDLGADRLERRDQTNGKETQ